MLHFKFFESENDSKQLLVMLHGFISDSTTYDSHVAYFSQHVNVLTIDLPGHGQDTSDMQDTWDFRILLMHLMRYCRNLTRMTCTYSAILWAAA